jgi:large subunit ribosomal protein L1
MPTLTKRMKVMAEKLPKTEAPISVEEAVKILKQFPPRKFDQSVELTMRLGIDAKQADQLVRGAIVLPHGIGKSKKVAVFAKGDKAEEAKAAGADFIGAEDLSAKIKEGWVRFRRLHCFARYDGFGGSAG